MALTQMYFTLDKFGILSRDDPTFRAPAISA